MACDHQREHNEVVEVTTKMSEENQATQKPEKYNVKSGVITYTTKLKTLSVYMSYKTIVYFDDYGRIECRDTYDSTQLRQTFMSDGKWLYQISHPKKTVYRTGKDRHGTEQKFDWNTVPQQDKDSGRAIKLPNEIIAGKDCEVYMVQADIAKAKYAGWQNILMLSEISSPGGTSTLIAVEVQLIAPPKEKFILPKDYLLRNPL